VIPAHPLALDEHRNLDARRQRALSRYYLEAGAGGLAVGVHTTQFCIREAGLYPRVLALAAEEADAYGAHGMIRIAGLVGGTRQALEEARTAQGLGYHLGLLSLAALGGASEDELIEHCTAVAAEMPLMGFYLQPAVGGRILPTTFWRRFAAIGNVMAIKIAPFNRYQTLDVLRGVVQAHAEQRITLYTGNDDHIVLDLLTPFVMVRDDQRLTLRIKGGLLGHWCVWTRRAVDLLERIQGASSPTADLMALDSQITDCNSAFFDVANGFRGCIAGCHEVLRRQGLMANAYCLDPDETLSPGQKEEIDRVYASYPALNDDAFVRENLERWLA
jgi:dihydrodipicolinate synthase/N-acetylneuraminate lyase